MQMSQHVQPDNLLRNTFFANIAFSLISTLLFLLATRPFATWLGMDHAWLLTILGIGFIPFMLFVYWVANERPINLRMARAIIIMDASWVVLSGLYLLFAWSDLTIAGRWFVFLQADLILLFALLQYLGVKRLS